MKIKLFLLTLLSLSVVNSDTLKDSAESDSPHNPNIPSVLSDTSSTEHPSDSFENELSEESDIIPDLSPAVYSAIDSTGPSISDTIKDTLSYTSDSLTDTQNVFSDTKEAVTFSDSSNKIIPVSEIDQSNSDKDTMSLSGWHFGFGAGLTLGNFPVLKLWETSLAESLEDFGLEPQSFMKNDTGNGPLGVSDTSLIAFTEIEAPAIYNMTFPLMVSIIRFRENDKFMSSLSFSHISKQQKASAFLIDDTTGSKVDIRNKLKFYSLTIDFLYSRLIPPEYFSIDKFDRTSFFIGAGISPLVSISTLFETNSHFDENDERMISIEKSISENTGSFTCYGLSAFFKTGISMVRRISGKRSMEISVSWSINKYDYFKNNGNKVFKKDINPDLTDNNKLSFLSNRLEFSFSLLNRLKRK